MSHNYVAIKEIAREITMILAQKSENKPDNVSSVTPQQV
jgi:hypothetical protein